MVFNYAPQTNNKLNLYLLSNFYIKRHCSYKSELFFALKRMRAPQVKKKKKKKFRFTFKHQIAETGVLATLESPKTGDFVINLKLIKLVTKNNKFINTRAKMSNNKKKGDERRKQR